MSRDIAQSWSGSSSPQAATPPARTAVQSQKGLQDNVPEIPGLVNPLSRSNEAAAAAASPQLNGFEAAAVEPFVYSAYSFSDLEDVPLSSDEEEEETDENIYPAPPPTSPEPQVASSSAFSEPGSSGSAAAANPGSKMAAVPDPEIIKQKFNELKASFISVKAQFEGAHASISAALAILPPKMLYKTAGANAIRDRMEPLREKAEAMLANLTVYTRITGNIISTLSIDKTISVPEAKKFDVWDYAQIGGTGALGVLVIAGTSVFGLGALVASASWGLSFGNLMAGASYVAAYVGAPITVGSLTGGGIASYSMMRAIEGSGGIAGLLKDFSDSLKRANFAAVKMSKMAEKTVRDLNKATEDWQELQGMFNEDIRKVHSLLIDASQNSAIKAMDWLKACAKKYHNKGEDFFVASLAYYMVSLEKPDSSFFRQNDGVKECFGSAVLVAQWLYRDSAKKFEFLLNIAVRFIENNCRGLTKEFNDAEYKEWKSIAGCLADSQSHSQIKFDLALARELEVKDRILIPVIAMRDYEIRLWKKECSANANKYIDSMIKRDAVEILLGDSADITTLITRTIKIYSTIFNEADAKKYTTLLVYTLVDPDGSLDPGTYDSRRQDMVNMAHDNQDIRIGKIGQLIFINNEVNQRELALDVAKHIMRLNYSLTVHRGGGVWEKTGSYNVEEFAKNPIIIECATFLRQDVQSFSNEVMTMLVSPAVSTPPPQSASPENSHDESPKPSDHRDELLEGQDWSFHAPTTALSYLGDVVEGKEP